MNEKNNKKILINIVLSKLDFTPKHYKIINKDNKIIIKCHYYKTYDNFYNRFNYNNSKPYNLSYTDHNTKLILECYNTSYELKNIDKTSGLNIIYSDILINLETMNYKIITSYYHIYKFNPNPDREALYSKIINILDEPSYYIIINDMYDNDLNMNINNIDEKTREFISKFDNYLDINLVESYRDILKLYYMNKFNMIITNDSDSIIINSIINNKITTYKEMSVNHISKDIDIKPHIDNLICINIKSGLLI